MNIVNKHKNKVSLNPQSSHGFDGLPQEDLNASNPVENSKEKASSKSNSNIQKLRVWYLKILQY